jgi:hypothetical protein
MGATTAATAAAASTPWMMYASLASSVLGGAMQMYGQYQQGQAAGAAGEYQAAVARNNAIMAERQAADALARGDAAEKQQRLRVQGMLGKQKSALAGAGVQLDEGSSGLDILGDTAAYGELDALTIRSNAEREAWGYRAQAGNYEAQARLNQMQGENSQMAGMIGAGSTLLTSAGSVADKWYTYQYGKPTLGRL